MRFMVNFRENTTMSATVPAPVIMELVEATGAWMDEMKKSGKFSDAAFYVPDHGGVAIINASSPAELFSLVEACPMRAFCTVETTPLIDYAEWKPVFQRSKAAALAMFERLQATAPKR